MRTAHALADGTKPGEHRPVLLTGVLAAVVGVQYQTLLITIARNRIVQGFAAQAGTHMMLHGKSDDRAILVVQYSG